MIFCFFFFQAEDGIRDGTVTGVQTCALPISGNSAPVSADRAAGLRPRGGAARRPDRHKPAHSPTLLPATAIGLVVPGTTLFAAGVLPTQTKLPEIVLPPTAGLGVPAKLAVCVFDDTSTFPVIVLKTIATGPIVE